MPDSRRILGWGLIAAALGAAAFMVFLVLRDDAPAALPDAGSQVIRREPGATAPEKPVIPPAPERPPPRPAPKPEPPATAAVTGRVVNADRRAMPGARIEALRGGNPGMPGLIELLPLGRRVVADDSGRFQLAGLAPLDDLMLRLDGERFALTEAGPFSVGAGQTLDLGDVIVAPGMLITGTVFAPNGRPIEGARVGLMQDTSRTGAPTEPGALPEPVRLVLSDPEGRFEIANANIGSFMLQVTADGYANALVPGSPTFGQTLLQVDVPVAMRLASVLRGRVVAADEERALAGARVVAEPLDTGNGRSAAVTDADGAFIITDLAPGNYQLLATAEGYSPGSARTRDETPDAEVVLRLAAQGSLSGVVLGSDGQPIRGFDLQPRHRQQRTGPAMPHGRFQRVSNPDGVFTLEGLDPGFWSVDVWAKGYSLTTSEAMRVKQGQHVEGLTVVLLRGSTLEGRVQDVEGLPLAGATVSLHGNREPEVDFLRDTTPLPGAGGSVRTDEDGRFRLEDLAARTYQVQVDHPDHALLRRDDVVVAAEQVVEAPPFVLQRSGTVRGAALSGAGEALGGVTVTLTSITGLSRQMVTDGRGQFLFTRVREDDYQLYCYGRQPSLSAMLSTLQHPPETFHVGAGATVQKNAVSLE